MRNKFRGDGVFDIDSSLAKSWSFGERARMKFAWEVFNVTNSVRFDDNTTNLNILNNELTFPGFGYYTTVMGKNSFRHMQFGLRIDF